MPRSRTPRPTVKNDDMYEALRREGNSKQKSARITNAAAAQGTTAVGRRVGKSPAYEEWTKDELVKRARELDVPGRSTMTKPHLIEAIRGS